MSNSCLFYENGQKKENNVKEAKVLFIMQQYKNNKMVDIRYNSLSGIIS
jgi:hypothetical protein